MKFLTTYQVASELETIIKEAKKELTLVTPYLNIPHIIYERLRSATKRGVKLTIIYGKSELNWDEEERIKELENLELYFFKELHAKCYYNERSLVLTSMNLYDYSARNNREMGILVNKNKVYKDAVAEVEDIKGFSELEFSSIFEPEQEKEVDNENVDDLLLTRLKEIFPDRIFKHGELWDDKTCVCHNYSEKMDVHVSHRVSVVLHFPKYRLKELHNNHQRQSKGWDHFEGFQLYWNNVDQPVYLYPDRNYEIWNNEDYKVRYSFLREGIGQLITYLGELQSNH